MLSADIDISILYNVSIGQTKIVKAYKKQKMLGSQVHFFFLHLPNY